MTNAEQLLQSIEEWSQSNNVAAFYVKAELEKLLPHMRKLDKFAGMKTRLQIEIQVVRGDSIREFCRGWNAALEWVLSEEQDVPQLSATCEDRESPDKLNQQSQVHWAGYLKQADLIVKGIGHLPELNQICALKEELRHFAQTLDDYAGMQTRAQVEVLMRDLDDDDKDYTEGWNNAILAVLNYFKTPEPAPEPTPEFEPCDAGTEPVEGLYVKIRNEYCELRWIADLLTAGNSEGYCASATTISNLHIPLYRRVLPPKPVVWEEERTIERDDNDDSLIYVPSGSFKRGELVKIRIEKVIK